MNEIENANKQIQNTGNTTGDINQQRRSQRQRQSPSPKTRLITTDNQLAQIDSQHSTQSNNKNTTVAVLTLPTVPTVTSAAGNSNSLPGHQSGRTKQNINRILEKDELNLFENTNSTGASGDHDVNNSASSLSRKKNLSTSDIDPVERKKQAALAKAESKLDKAQRLHQKAQQSVEQEISEFLRVTTIPNSTNESNTPKITNAAFDKRIRTLQETKRELEKKIANYRVDISRIQAGDIPTNYSSSKDIFSNIKSTAVKVASGSLKYRPTNTNDQSGSISTPSSIEQQTFQLPDSDLHQNNSNLSPTTLSTPPLSANVSGGSNNNQNFFLQTQISNTNDLPHSSLSSSVSNDIGNSQFYIDANYDHLYDNDKSSRKLDPNIPADLSTTHDNDKSPGRQRRLTDDSNVESNDRTSDHSADDRYGNNTSKRNAALITVEYQQLNTKVESMQKFIDRYENKLTELQKQIDSLVQANSNQYEQNERLNDDLSDLTNLHQTEMTTMKNDLKNLEERLVYKFNDYWNELLERLDKLDTRTAKVEQAQSHSFDREVDTHRIISKLVNILLTVFAIILLLLSTIKNVIQSRVHAMTLLIIVTSWLAFHYLPPNYFQTPFLRNFMKIFKRAARNNTSE